MKKKVIHIGPYNRYSYGHHTTVKGHYRGHNLSKRLPGSDGKKYRAGGKVHTYSPARDRARRAKHKRRHGKAHWRGDKRGSRI